MQDGKNHEVLPSRAEPHWLETRAGAVLSKHNGVDAVRFVAYRNAFHHEPREPPARAARLRADATQHRAAQLPLRSLRVPWVPWVPWRPTVPLSHLAAVDLSGPRDGAGRLLVS